LQPFWSTPGLLTIEMAAPVLLDRNWLDPLAEMATGPLIVGWVMQTPSARAQTDLSRCGNVRG